MISKTGSQALNALLIIEGLPDGVFIGAKEIANKTGSPQNYLGKILQMLANNGFLLSQKGAAGGFRLSKDSSKISLFDIIDTIENLDRKTGCILGQSRCTDKNACSLHFQWIKIRDSYLEFLKKTSLADLRNRQKKPGGRG